jgi:thiol-disulfide isomerase/thioredoxin
MKFAICILTLLLGLQAVAVAAESDTPSPAQILSGEKGEYLIGPLTRPQWEDFEPDLLSEYADYLPAPDLVDALVYGSHGIEIVCVLGTWCSDSRREVPRFWKIQDAMRDKAVAMKMIAVGRTDAPEAMIWAQDNNVIPDTRTRFDVTYVPTFIVMDGDVEIGRIIETPEVSLEADLATILGLTPSPKTH